MGGRKEESRALRCARCMRAPRVSWWELVSTCRGGELTSQRRRRERWAGRTSLERLCDRGGKRALAALLVINARGLVLSARLLLSS